MPNLSVQLGADTSKLVSGINQAKATLQDYIKSQNEASNASGENSSVTKEQAQAYEKVINSLQKVAEGSLSTKQSQKELANSVKELKEQWAALNNEARASSFGQSMSETMAAAKAELQEMKNSMSSVGDVKPNVTLKRELRMTSNELIKLTAQYRAMSDAEKASAQGQELARKMDQIREKAGELKDTIGDVESEITVMASDTPNLDVFNDLLGIGADALSTYSSVIAKVTGDEKALQDAIATVMAVQSAANLATKVTNALQSSSAIMLKTRAIQEGAAAIAIRIRTAAEGKGTIATKAATAAQRAFNIVAKANPYVLLATALLAVGAAIYAFTRKTNEATEAEKKAKEAAKAAEEEWKSFKETAASSGSTLLSIYSKLKTEWSNLKSEHEKNKWIEDNKEAFKNLGVEINNVSDAENFLENQTSKVVQAFMLRAKAAAYAALAVEKYKYIIQKELEYDKQKVSAGDEVPKWYRPTSVKRDDYGYATTANNGEFNVDSALTITSFTQKGADEYNKKLRERIGLTDKLTQEVQELTEAEVSIQKEANSILNDAGVKKTTSKTTTKNIKNNKVTVEPEFAPGSLAEMEAALSNLKDDYRKGWKVDMNKSQFLSEVKKLEERIKKKKIELGLEPEIPEGSLAYINKQISNKQNDLNLAIDDDSRNRIQNEIDELTGQKRVIELKLKTVVDKSDIDDIDIQIKEHIETVSDNRKNNVVNNAGADKVTKASNNLNEIKEELDFQKSIASSLQSQYDIIQDKIAAGGILDNNEKKLASIYEDAAKAVDMLSDSYNKAADNARELKLNSEIKEQTWEGVKGGISTIGTLNNAVKGTYDTWKSLGEQWNNMTPFEKTTAAIDATINTISSAIDAYENIIKMIELFGTISELSAAKKVAANTTEIASDEALVASQTTNTQLRIANNTAENTSEIGKLGVKEGSAIASATASGAALPFPANIAAIAAGIAAVVAAFAMVFSAFAEGGIVGGGSYIGDSQLVRVNSGEMILNGQQQKRLFNLLNGTDSRNGAVIGKGGVVKFKIKGNNLYGVLNNHIAKQNRV